MQKFIDIWRWRGFIVELVRRDIHSRYADAALGALWHFIQPLMQIVIYVVVFSEVMRSRLPGNPDAMAYSIFLCAGLLPWQLFADILGRSSSMFVDHATFLKKSGFPKICVPISVVISALVHFGIVMVFFLGLLVVSGRSPGWALLWVAPLTMVLVALAFGTGLLVGTLNVFLRDLGQIVAILMQFVFWLTPIVWPLNAVPVAWHHWFELNPMYGLMVGFQGVFLHGAAPALQSLLAPLITAGLFLLLGYVYFRKLSAEVADEL